MNATLPLHHIQGMNLHLLYQIFWCEQKGTAFAVSTKWKRQREPEGTSSLDRSSEVSELSRLEASGLSHASLVALTVGKGLEPFL